MNPMARAFLFLCVGAIALVPLAASAQKANAPGAVEAVRIATEAYIYGYPLVTFDMARRQQTNVAAPDAEHAPMGQVIKMRSYPAVDNHCCAAPNADTLYTEVWLDVSREPWIFSIPDMGNRYYIMPMLSGWSEVFKVASSNTTGGKPQVYAITGPGWAGTLPNGVVQVKSPTAMVWILGRIYTNGTPEDYKAVHALQDRFTIVPLSSYGKPYTPPAAVVDPAFDMKTAVRKQVNAMGIDAYFNRLAELMKTNPPGAQDAAMVAQMARIGLVPGQAFDAAKLGFLDEEAIRLVPKLAVLEMGLHLKKQKTTNGWLYFTKGVGNFGTDYLTRGMANLLGPGWNRPQDAVYPLSQKDAAGDEYDGAKTQVRHPFRQGQAAAGGCLLVADDVRRRLLLRAQCARPLRPRPARQARHQRGWLGGPVSAGRVAGQGQGSQLAARAEGQVRAGDADLLAEGHAALDSRRHMDAAPGEARAVTVTFNSDRGVTQATPGSTPQLY